MDGLEPFDGWQLITDENGNFVDLVPPSASRDNLFDFDAPQADREEATVESDALKGLSPVKTSHPLAVPTTETPPQEPSQYISPVAAHITLPDSAVKISGDLPSSDLYAPAIILTHPTPIDPAITSNATREETISVSIQHGVHDGSNQMRMHGTPNPSSNNGPSLLSSSTSNALFTIQAGASSMIQGFLPPPLRKSAQRNGADGRPVRFNCSVCSGRGVHNGNNDGQQCTRCFNKAVARQTTSLQQNGSEHRLQPASAPIQAHPALPIPTMSNQQQIPQQPEQQASIPKPIDTGDGIHITLRHTTADAARQYTIQPPAADCVQIADSTDNWQTVKREEYFQLCRQLVDAMRQPYAPASTTWDRNLQTYYDNTSRDTFERVRHKLETNEQIAMAHAYAMTAISDAIAIHEFGIPKISLQGARAFSADTTLHCRERIQRMISVVQASACAKKDVVLGKTKELVWNPDKYAAGKRENLVLNCKRKGDLSIATAEKKKRYQAAAGDGEDEQEEVPKKRGRPSKSKTASIGPVGMATFPVQAVFGDGINLPTAASNGLAVQGSTYGQPSTYNQPSLLGQPSKYSQQSCFGPTSINGNGKRYRAEDDDHLDISAVSDHQAKRARPDDELLIPRNGSLHKHEGETLKMPDDDSNSSVIKQDEGRPDFRAYGTGCGGMGGGLKQQDMAGAGFASSSNSVSNAGASVTVPDGTAAAHDEDNTLTADCLTAKDTEDHVEQQIISTSNATETATQDTIVNQTPAETVQADGGAPDVTEAADGLGDSISRAEQPGQDFGESQGDDFDISEFLDEDFLRAANMPEVGGQDDWFPR